uniref:Uncharacterized protein n=1 Tax=Avena sativa TaxID=4498 RepID=A0ACD5WHG2_AVESA
MEGQGDPPNTRAALSHAAVPGAAATVPGGSVDRLSRLPDHLLVYILLKLPIKQAGKTRALSRHWRGMWAQLPVLEFEGVNSSVIVRALAAYQDHGEDDILSFTVFSKQMDAQQITAWLSLAPPLLSGRLYFDNRHTVSREVLQRFLDDDEEAVVRGDALELPCFNKATEILMDLGFLGLALPPAGVFDALRMMWLEHFWFRGQLSISDTMFPSLEELIICRVRGLVVLTLNSKFLLDIHLSVLPEFQELNILAPRLEELDVTDCFYDVLSEPVASIAAERLKVLRWEVPCVPDPVCLRKMPPLLVLQAPPISTHWSEHICAEFLNCFPEADQLKLQISLRVSASSSSWT